MAGSRICKTRQQALHISKLVLHSTFKVLKEVYRKKGSSLMNTFASSIVVACKCGLKTQEVLMILAEDFFDNERRENFQFLFLQREMEVIKFEVDDQEFLNYCKSLNTYLICCVHI